MQQRNIKRMQKIETAKAILKRFKSSYTEDSGLFQDVMMSMATNLSEETLNQFMVLVKSSTIKGPAQ